MPPTHLPPRVVVGRAPPWWATDDRAVCRFALVLALLTFALLVLHLAGVDPVQLAKDAGVLRSSRAATVPTPRWREP